MSYRWKRFPLYRRKRYRKRPAYRPKKTVKKIVKKEIAKSKEYKQVQVTASTASTAAWQFVHLSQIAQGDDETQRDGNCVTLKSLEARFIINVNASSTTNSLIRVVLFKDMQGSNDPTAATADNTDVFTVASIQAFKNDECKKRYVILYDKVVMVNFVTGPRNLFLKFYKKMTSDALYYGSGATERVKGHLWLAFLGYDASTYYPTLTYNTKTLFQEK